MNEIRFPSSFALLRYVFRGMWQRPGFTTAVVLTLALGIGATTAIFSVVYGVLLKPLPYPSADELVSLRHTAAGRSMDQVQPLGSMYVTYAEENRTFQHVGLWTDGGQSLTGLGEPEQVRTVWVTHGTLQALGVEPREGRWFTESDYTSVADGSQPVILSNAFWQRRFGGDGAALGKEFLLDSIPTRVIGIMPASFRFLNVTPQPDVILAARIELGQLNLTNYNFRGGVARLKNGMTLADANADVARMLPVWLDAWPAPPGGASREAIANWRLSPALQPLKADLVGSVARTLWLLMATIGVVLLIACANIANLLLVRTDARHQEFAIRAALGAGPLRISWQVLLESIAFGAVGGVLGVGLAYAGLELVVALGPTNLPRLQDVSVDPFVLAFAATASLFSSLVFGLIPALKQALRTYGLGTASRGTSASRERNSARNVLIVVQVAFALVLLVGAGLMIRSFQALSAVAPGFSDPEDVQVARIWIPPSVIREPERVLRVQRDILDKIASLPGVTASGFGSGAPMEEGRTFPTPVYVEDKLLDVDETPPVRRLKPISPGYLEAVGTRLVAGRDLAWPDLEQGGKVAVISENMARELWGEPSAAIGKRIRESAPGTPGVWREVIGVAQDVYEDGLYQKPPTTVYFPVFMESSFLFGDSTFGVAAIAYVIRSERAGTASFVNEIQRAVWSVNPDLPVFLIRTVQDLYAASMAQTSFALVLLAITAAMALCLGVVGIYGVISYVVSQRSREIGIRLALGAEPTAVRQMFVRHGLGLAMIGAVIGLAVAVMLSRSMSSLLFGVSPLDPVTFITVLAVLVTAVAIATYVPARRASAVDPAVTLKSE